MSTRAVLLRGCLATSRSIAGASIMAWEPGEAADDRRDALTTTVGVPSTAERPGLAADAASSCQFVFKKNAYRKQRAVQRPPVL